MAAASRPYAAAGDSNYAHRPTSSDAFLRDAEAALATFRQGGVLDRRRRGRLHPSARLKRLVFSLNQDVYRAARPYWMTGDDDHEDDRVCGLALAHPAASQLEQLLLSCWPYGVQHRPRLESLRCAATLRLLDLEFCNLDPPKPAPPVALALPSLAKLSLKHCVITEGYLQVLVEAATALTNLELVNLRHKTAEQAVPASLRLRCPTVTVLVLDAGSRSLNEEHKALDNGGIELDMPSLRSFRYSGCPAKISLTSPTSALEQTDLDVTRRDIYLGTKPWEPVSRSRVLGSFSCTRALTLRMQCLEDIVDGEEEGGEVILPIFPNLKTLVLDGSYKHMNKDMALAMARLLGSCPMMSELRLRLNRTSDWEESKKDPPGGAFSVSMDRFNRLASMASVQGSNGVGVSCEISELTALSGCTLSFLRKVTLRFNANNELNCFPIQLAKFVAENAMDLEEMHVNDGSQLWTDHLYNNVGRWRADSFRRKNLPVTGRFRPCSVH